MEEIETPIKKVSQEVTAKNFELIQKLIIAHVENKELLMEIEFLKKEIKGLKESW